MLRCPGQDQRFWKPEDVFEVHCPGCGRSVEFFKDEPNVKCRNCSCVVINTKINLGCAQWCRYATQCAGASSIKGNTQDAQVQAEKAAQAYSVGEETGKR